MDRCDQRAAHPLDTVGLIILWHGPCSSSLLVTGLHPSFKYFSFPKGERRGFLGFPQGFRRVSRRFPEGFRRVSEHFVKGVFRVSAFFMVFAWVCAGFRNFREGFSICGRFSLQGFCSLGGLPGFLFFRNFWNHKPAKAGEKLSRSLRSVVPNLQSLGHFWSQKTWKIRNGASPVAISVFRNLKNVLWKKTQMVFETTVKFVYLFSLFVCLFIDLAS